jgi:putative inorganic carbon (hco3(-)) transporter
LIAATVMLGYVRLRYAVLLAGVAAVILLNVPQYVERLGTIQDVVEVATGQKSVRHFDTAVLGRVTEMWAAACVFLEHPLIGVGPGMFPYHFLDYAGDLGVRVHNALRQPHNLYLGLAAEHGLLGLFVFLAMLAQVGRMLLRTRRLAPEMAHTATAFLLLVIVYLAVGMFADFAYVRYFWLMMALACATVYVGPEIDHGRRQAGPEIATS